MNYGPELVFPVELLCLGNNARPAGRDANGHSESIADPTRADFGQLNQTLTAVTMSYWIPGIYPVSLNLTPIS
jgi:hypothetical protein